MISIRKSPIFMKKYKPPAISQLADGLPPKGGLMRRFSESYLAKLN